MTVIIIFLCERSAGDFGHSETFAKLNICRLRKFNENLSIGRYIRIPAPPRYVGKLTGRGGIRAKSGGLIHNALNAKVDAIRKNIKNSFILIL